MLSTGRLVSLLAALAIVAPVVAMDTGCASSSAAKKKKKKGAGAKGAAAKSSGQKAGGVADGAKATGEKKGAEEEGAKCDAELEGVAWCGDDTHVITCFGGEWYAVNCAAVNGGLCAEDDESHLIDCDPAADVE